MDVVGSEISQESNLNHSGEEGPIKNLRELVTRMKIILLSPEEKAVEAGRRSCHSLEREITQIKL